MNQARTYLPVAVAVGIYLARILELRTSRVTVRGPVQEKFTFWWFMLCGTLMFVGALVEYFWRERTASWALLAVGAVSAAASFLVRRRAIANLGQFWSLHVEIRENHQFVQSGPFRWMRHPTYFSMILELLSVALILNAVATAAVVTLLFVPALLVRLRIEERALVEKFGPTYEAYQLRTPALIPYKWPTLE